MSNHYPRNSAGRRMTERVPVARLEDTAGAVLKSIEERTGDFDTIHSVYVVDEAGRLMGSMRLKQVYHMDREARLGSALRKNHLVTVTPETHQENVAALAVQHELTEVPVVDGEGRLRGVVPDQAVIDILHREAREDVFRMTGVHPAHGAIDSILDVSLLQALKHRLPWLLIGMAGGLATARIIGVFEATLERNLILASFIPLVVYLADAVGMQMTAFVIRDFAIFRNLDFRRYFLKQLVIVVAIAAILGMIGALVGLVLFPDRRIAAVLGISLVAAILSSVVTGLMIPYAFRSLRLDPADASGPIATILQDFLSVVIYLLTASLILRI